MEESSRHVDGQCQWCLWSEAEKMQNLEVEGEWEMLSVGFLVGLQQLQKAVKLRCVEAEGVGNLHLPVQSEA